MDKPADWKNYDDFAAGIDTNRLPGTNDLVGQEWTITFPSQTIAYHFTGQNGYENPAAGTPGEDWYEAVSVAPQVYFIDTTSDANPREARTLIVNTQTRRVLSILSRVREVKVEGEPQVAQVFEAGLLGGEGPAACSLEPTPTRDLIGLRAFYRYSPNHLYEHIYLSSQRYAWQNLVGEQRGHGDVDLATTYKFDDQQYVFTFREFIIPVASVFFYNFEQMRSTGKFLGITGNGRIQNNPAGATIQLASMTYYDKSWAPV